MIRYEDEVWTELKFTSFQYEALRRDEQWVDVILRVSAADDTPMPPDLLDFTIMAVCTHEGYPIQLATMDEGCDCEYQLTKGEKEQVHAFLYSEEVKNAIVLAAKTSE